MELSEYTAMMRRMIRAYSRRVGAADLEDLTEMLAMRDELDQAIADAVAAMRAGDESRQIVSWASIGRAAGVTRQAAFQRWGKADAAPAAAAQVPGQLTGDSAVSA